MYQEFFFLGIISKETNWQYKNHFLFFLLQLVSKTIMTSNLQHVLQSRASETSYIFKRMGNTSFPWGADVQSCSYTNLSTVKIFGQLQGAVLSRTQTMFYFFSLSPKTDGGLINEQIVVKAKMRKKMQGFFSKNVSRRL